MKPVDRAYHLVSVRTGTAVEHHVLPVRAPLDKLLRAFLVRGATVEVARVMGQDHA